MARVNYTSFETADTIESSGDTSNIAFSSAIKRSGSYSLRCNAVTTGVSYYTIHSFSTTTGAGGNYNIATMLYRFYIWIVTLPGSNSEPIAEARSTVSTTKLELRVTSAGKLAAYDSAISQLGSDGTTVLQTGRWYRIEMKVGTGAAADYEIKINGTSELSGTGNLTTSNNGQLKLGKYINRNGQTVDFYYDDVALDDADYPGAGKVAMMLPNGNGNYTDATIGAGAGELWEQIDEIPPDGDTTYILTTLTIDQAYTAALQTAASAGISGTINSAKLLIIVKGNSGGGGTIRPRLRSGTTDVGTSSNTGISAITPRYVRANVDPNTGAAWTTGGLDGAEVGYVERETTDKTRMTFAALVVDYAPTDPEFPTAGAIINQLQGNLGADLYNGTLI